MNEHKDPIDSALDSLRSVEWTHKPNHELEEKLMQEFNRKQPSGGFFKSHPLVAILGVLIIGGAAVAATNGIKRWLVTVEIDGQVAEVETDEQGEATVVMDTGDGQATVHVQRVEDPDGGAMARVEVVKTSDDGTEEDVEKVIKKQRRAEPETVDPAVLGDAEALHEWTDEINAYALYILPDGDGSQIYLAKTPDDGETVVYALASPPVPLVGEGIDTSVEVDDNGMVHINSSDGAGREIGIAFKVADSADEPACDTENLDIDEANVKVDFDEIEDE